MLLINDVMAHLRPRSVAREKFAWRFLPLFVWLQEKLLVFQAFQMLDHSSRTPGNWKLGRFGRKGNRRNEPWSNRDFSLLQMTFVVVVVPCPFSVCLRQTPFPLPSLADGDTIPDPGSGFFSCSMSGVRQTVVIPRRIGIAEGNSRTFVLFLFCTSFSPLPPPALSLALSPALSLALSPALSLALSPALSPTPPCPSWFGYRFGLAELSTMAAVLSGGWEKKKKSTGPPEL
ncbi:hypothetical protein L209DRAFT_44875 [Thermothelomyces heterothallicus CBS 203.75]